jgi:hypothetical protein
MRSQELRHIFILQVYFFFISPNETKKKKEGVEILRK